MMTAPFSDDLRAARRRTWRTLQRYMDSTSFVFIDETSDNCSPLKFRHFCGKSLNS